MKSKNLNESDLLPVLKCLHLAIKRQQDEQLLKKFKEASLRAIGTHPLRFAVEDHYSLSSQRSIQDLRHLIVSPMKCTVSKPVLEVINWPIDIKTLGDLSELESNFVYGEIKCDNLRHVKNKHTEVPKKEQGH